MIVDLGTGDGRAVLALAAGHPGALVIGIDADPRSMADSSRRAARSPRKGGLSNALFVAAAAEAPPRELIGCADEVRVLFPWGSLLRGVLGLDAAATAGIAELVGPTGRCVTLFSVTPRDRVPGVAAIDTETIARMAAAFDAVGLALVDARPARPDEIAETRSTWGRRLLAGGDRAVWRAELARSPASLARRDDPAESHNPGASGAARR